MPENPFRGNRGVNSHVLTKKTSVAGASVQGGDKKSQSLSRTRGKERVFRPDTRKEGEQGRKAASKTPHTKPGAGNRYQVVNNAHMKIHDENDEDVLIGDAPGGISSKQATATTRTLTNIKDCFLQFKQNMIDAGNYIPNAKPVIKNDEKDEQIKALQDQIKKMQE